MLIFEDGDISQAPLHNLHRHQIKLPNWRAFGLKNGFFFTLFYSFFVVLVKKWSSSPRILPIGWQIMCTGPLDLGSVLHEQLLTFVFWTRWSYADIVWSVVQTNHARVKTILTRFVPLRKDGCCCCYEIARVSSLVTAGRPWISTLWFGLNFLDLHCLHDI